MCIIALVSRTCASRAAASLQLFQSPAGAPLDGTPCRMDASFAFWLSSRTSGTPWTGAKLAGLVLAGAEASSAYGSAAPNDALHLTPARLQEVAAALGEDGGMLLETETKLALLSALAVVRNRRVAERERAGEGEEEIFQDELDEAISAVASAACEDSDSWVGTSARLLLDQGQASSFGKNADNLLLLTGGAKAVTAALGPVQEILETSTLEYAPLEASYTLLTTLPPEFAELYPASSVAPRSTQVEEEISLRFCGDRVLPRSLRGGRSHFSPDFAALGRRMGNGLRGQPLFRNSSGRGQTAGRARPGGPARVGMPRRPESIHQPPSGHVKMPPTAAELLQKKEEFRRRLAAQQAEVGQKRPMQILDAAAVAAAQQNAAGRSRSVEPSQKRARVSSAPASASVSRDQATAASNELMPTAPPVMQKSASKSSREAQRQERDESDIRNLLVEDNSLNQAGRRIIERFLRGDHEIPSQEEIVQAEATTKASSVEGGLVLEIVLNRNSQYHADRAVTEEETVVFEMTYSTSSYRKLRKRRTMA